MRKMCTFGILGVPVTCPSTGRGTTPQQPSAHMFVYTAARLEQSIFFFRSFFIHTHFFLCFVFPCAWHIPVHYKHSDCSIQPKNSTLEEQNLFSCESPPPSFRHNPAEVLDGERLEWNNYFKMASRCVNTTILLAWLVLLLKMVYPSWSCLVLSMHYLHVLAMATKKITTK